MAGREGLNASQLDLERIEVLKGPQSTKYGRNAFAGAINYVTARPGDELEVRGSNSPSAITTSGKPGSRSAVR